jgi:hypothetical protein
MSQLRLAEIIARADLLRFEERVVLKYDLSNLKHKEDIAKVFDYFSKTVERMPEKSMYCLLDITGLSESVVSCEEMSRDTAQHSLYFKAAAVVANDDMSGVLVKKVREKLKIYLPIYKKEQEAIDWLCSLNEDSALPAT